MKKLISLLFIALSISATAQFKQVALSETIIAGVYFDYSYGYEVGKEKQDTFKFVRIKFSNERYRSISDWKTILLKADSNNILEFTRDLKNAYAEMNKKTDLTWSNVNYNIALDKSSSFLYLLAPNKDGGGYTIFTKKQTQKVIDWLDSNGFK